MSIKAILASTRSGGIGNNGSLPWPKNTEDLKWFKKHTVNNVVVMGKNTWNDPMMPRPLPQRVNFVVTRTAVYEANSIYGSIDEILSFIRTEHPALDIFIIGGKQLYESAFSYCDEIYLTTVAGEYETDTNLDLTFLPNEFKLIYKELTRSNTYEIWRRNAAISQPPVGDPE